MKTKNDKKINKEDIQKLTQLANLLFDLYLTSKKAKPAAQKNDK